MQSLLFYSSEFETLDNVLARNLDKSFFIGYSRSEFDESLDFLNFSDKLNSTKPKKAETDTFFLSYSLNKIKISYETFDSTGIVSRASQPRSLQTDVHADHNEYCEKNQTWRL